MKFLVFLILVFIALKVCGVSTVWAVVFSIAALIASPMIFVFLAFTAAFVWAGVLFCCGLVAVSFAHVAGKFSK